MEVEQEAMYFLTIMEIAEQGSNFAGERMLLLVTGSSGDNNFGYPDSPHEPVDRQSVRCRGNYPEIVQSVRMI